MNEKIIIKNIYIFFFILFIYFRKVKIPLFENPIVSIIIPVYNKFRYTNKCIHSIINENRDIPYEIIIADDMSTDLTKYIKNYFVNIHINKNEKEHGFVNNCNNAANVAKGKYIVFLNNDVQVKRGWLSNLVKLIESNEKIGMVGSKLIYPNGTLQEAGGIIWRDGSGCNYGRGKDPEMAEYNYVKEVDYISGASIMIKKSIWEEIGGFDKRYYPAYYEDTDFGFEVRKHGYKVMYQPLSVAIHLEGVSNGRDLHSGLKKFQIKNQKKFLEKWKEELKNQSTPQNIFNARDRSFNKKRILVFDRFVPNFDKDAGSRCSYMYLKIFQKIGLVVTFIGDDFKKYEPYTSFLEQLGIEVLYGDIYLSNIYKWLNENLNNFDFVFLQRPSIAIKYIDLIKKNFIGKIFYYAHDLQYIRLYREYKITQNNDTLKASEFWKNKEIEIFSKVDVGYVVGSYEQKTIHEKFNDKTIRNIPIYIYEKNLTNISKDFSKRKDLIFVGSFLHSPNKDGILWFTKEIYPLVLDNYSKMVLHIIGSNMTIEIKELESENIKVYDSISDEDLKSLYQKCRIAIAPLRFGAGVKGKIVEAAYYQIPIITTSIGAEGLDNTLGAILVEDSPIKMAKLINSIYFDYEKLKKISSLEKLFIEKYFTFEKAKEIILKDIEPNR